MEAYLPQVIASAVIIVLLPLTRYIVRKLVEQSGRIMQMPDPRILQIKHVFTLIISISFLIALAVVWGVEAENLVLALSSIFAVIGVAFFAQWSILSNMTAGILMYFSAPYRIGTRIQFLDKDIPMEAVIENIQTFYTHVRTVDNELVAIPNNLFLQKVVVIKEE